MTQWVKISEGQWAKFPDGMSQDEMKQRLGMKPIQRGARLAAISQGKDIPPGSEEIPSPSSEFGGMNLGVAGRYLNRVLKEGQAGAEEFNTLPGRGANQGEGFVEAVKSIPGVNQLLGATRVGFAPIAAAGQELASHLGGGEEPAEAGGRTAEFAFMGGQAIHGIHNLMTEKPSPRIVQTESGPIKLKTPVGQEPQILDPETGEPLVENKPPTPENQIINNERIKAAGIDTNDPKSVLASEMKRAGVPPTAAEEGAAKATVGEVPVSTSKMGDDGVPEVQLADEAPASATHEAEHMGADATGRSQPPEDNDAIIEGLFKNKEGEWGKAPPENYEVRSGRNVYARQEPESPETDISDFQAKSVPRTQQEIDTAWAKERWVQPPQQGPMETATAESPTFDEWGNPSPEPPPGVTEQASPIIGNEAKWKRGANPARPLPQTLPPPPGTPPPVWKQVAVKSWNAAQYVTKLMQSAVSTLSGGTIFGAGNLRVGLYAMAKAGAEVEKALFGIGAENPWEGFKMLSRIYSRGDVKPLLELMGREHPEETRMFLAGGSFDPGTNKLAQALGSINRIAHMLPKAAVFTTRLESTLMERLGIDVWDLVKKGDLSSIPKEYWQDAMLMGNRMGMTATPMSEWGKRALSLVANPVGRLVDLFPRLGYNVLKATGDTSPHLMLKLLSPAAKAEIGSGNPDAAVQGMQGVIGALSIIAGYKLAEQNPKFMVLDIGSGRSIDLKHLVPGPTQWAGIGQMIYKDLHVPRGVSAGRAITNNLGDAVQLLAGVPQIGMTFLGDFIKGDVTDANLGRAVGRTLGTFTHPGQAIEHMIAIFDEEWRKQRDVSGSIWDTTINNIPFLNQTLPEQHAPNRAAPLETYGALKDVGIPLIEAQTPVQKEMERLYIRQPWYPIKGKGKIPASAANNKYREIAGADVEKQIGDKMKEPNYIHQPDSMKRVILEGLIRKIDAGARVKSGATPEQLRSTEKQDLIDDVRAKYETSNAP